MITVFHQNNSYHYLQQLTSQQWMGDQGLAFCGSSFDNAFCICKLLQVIISSIMLIVVFYDLIVRYDIERQINFFVVICMFMILALISNIVFSFDHQIYIMNDLQGYFFNIYFEVIVYHIALKLYAIKKDSMSYKQQKKWAIHIIFIVYNIVLLGILIYNMAKPYKSCEETWYIFVDSLGLISSTILVVLGVIHTQRQRKKLRGIKNPEHYKNPLFAIWVWISLNIASEVVSFIYSLIFLIRPQLECSFSIYQNVDVIIKFIMAMLSFHLGMGATIVFFRNKYDQDEKRLRSERIRKQSANIELVEQFQNTINEND